MREHGGQKYGIHGGSSAPRDKNGDRINTCAARRKTGQDKAALKLKRRQAMYDKSHDDDQKRPGSMNRRNR